MPALLSELEAVNKMLRVIGEAPVDNLETSGLSDVGIAVQILDEVGREIQNAGWRFNSETNFIIVPNGADNLVVAANVLRAKLTVPSYAIDPVLRGSRFYDRKNRTYVFDGPHEFDVVIHLPFDEVPQAARQYITIVAARRFQTSILGSETLHGFTAEQEFIALSAIKEAEAENSDYNILTSDVGYSILNR